MKSLSNPCIRYALIRFSEIYCYNKQGSGEMSEVDPLASVLGDDHNLLCKFRNMITMF